MSISATVKLTFFLIVFILMQIQIFFCWWINKKKKFSFENEDNKMYFIDFHNGGDGDWNDPRIKIRRWFSVCRWSLIQLLFYYIYTHKVGDCGKMVLDLRCKFRDRASIPSECQIPCNVDKVNFTIASVASSKISNTLLRWSPSNNTHCT